jgi:2-polyprenyl-3-methyl-5-hydroxy-6-metoxy-1,4-benzoquinol methylase
VIDYWNHNTAYHPWILRAASRGRTDDVLDVGCGDGLLLQRFAPSCLTVTGVEPDAATAERARTRLRSTSNATVIPTDFADFDADGRRFDVITFVATLHHMDARSSLAKAAALLRPGGCLLVVGLAANRTIADGLLSALALPWVRLGSMLHRESRDIGVPTAPAELSVADIRALAGELLPGARLRRGLYYRYLLSWTKPTTETSTEPEGTEPEGTVADAPR